MDSSVSSQQLGQYTYAIGHCISVYSFCYKILYNLPLIQLIAVQRWDCKNYHQQLDHRL